MGADLHMIEPSHDEHRDRLRPIWDQAIRDRDLKIKRLEADGTKLERTEDFGFKHPQVQALQDRINALMALMNPEHLYFRDPYNSWCLASYLEFSWWHDVTPMLDEDRVLPPDKCMELANRIRWREIGPDKKMGAEAKFALAAAEAVIAKEAPGATMHQDEGPNQAWLAEKRDRLVRFLELGAKSKGIRCSL